MISTEDETANEQNQLQTWIEKLSRVFLREPKSRKEWLDLLQDAKEKGILDTDSIAMIEGAIAVAELKVRDIMIPRAQMVVLEKDAQIQTILPIINESGHSRFPVIGENRDDIVGILLAKDLLRYQFQETDYPFEQIELLRKPVFVPESKRADNLLREFRLNHNHMAIIVDEYGGVSGLVTIEDILEEIVGNIEDEYDIDEEPNIRETTENTFVIKALTPIDEFNKFFVMELSDEEADTLGGFICQILGYLPKKGEIIHYGRCRFKILNADNRQIRLIQVRIKT